MPTNNRRSRTELEILMAPSPAKQKETKHIGNTVHICQVNFVADHRVLLFNDNLEQKHKKYQALIPLGNKETGGDTTEYSRGTTEWTWLESLLATPERCCDQG
jgi:hypothetical protein